MLLSLGCATKSKDYTNYLNTQAIEKRVAGRWKARVAKNHEEAYNYIIKSYRDTVNYKGYTKTINPRITWEKYDIIRTHCEEDICKVNIEVNYSMPPMFGLPHGVKTVETMKETWLYQAGEWFYLPPKN